MKTEVKNHTQLPSGPKVSIDLTVGDELYQIEIDSCITHEYEISVSNEGEQLYSERKRGTTPNTEERIIEDALGSLDYTHIEEEIEYLGPAIPEI